MRKQHKDPFLISFRPFRQWAAKDPNIKLPKDLISAGLNPRTANKILNDEQVHTSTIGRVCQFFGLKVEEVIEYIPPKKWAVNIKENKAYLAEEFFEQGYSEEEILQKFSADLIIEAALENQALEFAKEEYQ